jgi:ketosteroid isomerase-like protein
MRAAISLVVFALLLAAPPSASASEETDALARIRQFVEAYNKNDSAAVAGMVMESIEIISVFPPYHWSGPHALQDWSEGFAKAAPATERSVELRDAKHVTVKGDSAYLVIPAIYRRKRGAESVEENGILTSVLHRFGEQWKVAAFTWTRE